MLNNNYDFNVLITEEEKDILVRLEGYLSAVCPERNDFLECLESIRKKYNEEYKRQYNL